MHLKNEKKSFSRNPARETFWVMIPSPLGAVSIMLEYDLNLFLHMIKSALV